jgi:hypothetical protein
LKIDAGSFASDLRLNLTYLNAIQEEIIERGVWDWKKIKKRSFPDILYKKREWINSENPKS